MLEEEKKTEEVVVHSRTSTFIPEKEDTDRSRERRRRRIEKRNSIIAANNGGRVWPWRSSIGNFAAMTDGGAGSGEVVNSVQKSDDLQKNVPPLVGAVAVSGRLETMEDAATIQIDLCSPALNQFKPLHFFGVFDGHGGAHFAKMCKEKMHGIFENEVMDIGYMPYGEETLLQEAYRRVFGRCFARTEMVAMSTCSCGSIGFLCSCDREIVFRAGSTAVTVVLAQQHIIVANCGDSRAILCRGGRVVPLSFDHKPDVPNEKARIEASGGHVLNLDTARVEGVLAMSRAIGDRYLKPSVSSDPEVTFTRRTTKDEFIILASDGLWDVMSNEMVCRVVRECLREPGNGIVVNVSDNCSNNDTNARNGRIQPPSQSVSAAALLTRLALARLSTDNICVVVIDLMRAGVMND